MTIPGVKAIGNNGHTTDHNLITAHLATLLPTATASATYATLPSTLLFGNARFTHPSVMASPPTITQGASGGAGTVGDPVSFRYSLRPDKFWITGSDIGLAADASYLTQESVTPFGTNAFAPFSAIVQTDAPRVEVSVRGNGQKFRFWVDGELVNADGSTLSEVGGGNVRIQVDFAGVRQMRTIRFDSDATRMGEWVVDEPSTFLPGIPQGPRVLIMGDSVTEGTGATNRLKAWPRLFGELMGWQDVWASGSGGTGYTVTGTPTYTDRVKMRDRIDTDVIPFAPDIVYLTAGINDQSQPGIQAEVEGCITDIQDALPGTIIFATGPLWVKDTTVALTAVSTAISAGAAAQGVAFFDLFTPEAFGGTGKVGSTTADGPADYLMSADGTHPSPAGHEAIARQIASMTIRSLRGLS